MEHRFVECSSHRLLLPLQELSLIKITAIISNNKQLLPLITKCTVLSDPSSCISSIPEKNWMAIKVKANQLISQIHIGVALKKKILENLWPMSCKIILWKSMFAKTIGNKFLRHFYWTDQGRINNTKTIRYIVSEKKISTRKRFILSCSVCLREQVCEIWREMSPKDKNYFYSGAREEISLLISFWARSLGGSDYSFEDNVINAAICAVQKGLLEAVKYLFSISTAESRKRMSIFCMKFFSERINTIYLLTEDEVDLGYFLFFEMSAENQKSFFNIHPYVALSLSLYSSEEKHFLNLLAERFQSGSSQNEIHDIGVLIMKVFYEYHFELRRNFDYGILICKIWGMLSEGVRHYVGFSDIGAFIFMVLIRDNFSFLLKKDAPVNIFDMLSCSERSMSGITFRFNRSKWSFLQFLVREQIVTTYTLKKYRRNLSQHVCMDKISWNKIVLFVNKMKKNLDCK